MENIRLADRYGTADLRMDATNAYHKKGLS